MFGHSNLGHAHRGKVGGRAGKTRVCGEPPGIGRSRSSRWVPALWAVGARRKVTANPRHVGKWVAEQESGKEAMRSSLLRILLVDLSPIVLVLDVSVGRVGSGFDLS